MFDTPPLGYSKIQITTSKSNIALCSNLRYTTGKISHLTDQGFSKKLCKDLNSPSILPDINYVAAILLLMEASLISFLINHLEIKEIFHYIYIPNGRFL